MKKTYDQFLPNPSIVSTAETIIAKNVRLERYLSCNYDHPKTFMMNFYCSKCGYSESEWRKHDTAIQSLQTRPEKESGE